MLQVLHTELPTTLDAMERASLEFDELGRSLNQLINPLRRLPARQQQRAAAAAAAADGAKAGTGAGGSSGVALTIGGVGIPLAGLSAVTASGMGAVSGAGQAGGEAMRRLAADLAVLTRVRMQHSAYPRPSLTKSNAHASAAWMACGGGLAVKLTVLMIIRTYTYIQCQGSAVLQRRYRPRWRVNLVVSCCKSTSFEEHRRVCLQCLADSV